MFYRIKPTTAADRKLTNVEPNSSFKPKRATVLPCFSFKPLIAPATIPIEEKLAKETKNTDKYRLNVLITLLQPLLGRPLRRTR